ncbi:ATP-binding protein [Desulforhopalus singaporensis]|uniref:histidine kinase n=1 Tax=Desulforhopalus singaporensis TaxID=91360 RepID=A0A1H0SCB6_9BACT|nr:transporter substrate-binding domain-containing protein [Desulforhopalus singaporensis]SDP39403.1 His Kinase A (phospho-acceptor) domain-containing protein [Desulforhopalus singaporensis]
MYHNNLLLNNPRLLIFVSMGQLLYWGMSILVVLIFSGSIGYAEDKQDPLSPSQRQWLREHEDEIILVEYNGFPPMEFRNDEDEWVGISSDYINVIEKRLGFKFKRIRAEELTMDSWVDLTKNKIVTKCNLQKTRMRSERFLFTEPYVEFPHAIIVNKDTKGDFSLDKLKGMKISVARYYAIHELLSASNPHLDLDPVDGDLVGLQRVAFKKSDAMIVNFATASYYIEKEGLVNLRFAGTVGEPNKLRFATSSNCPEFHEILKVGLRQIDDKERKAIYDRWISLGREIFITSRTFWNIMFISSAVVLVIVLVSFKVNSLLKDKVAQKTRELEEELAVREKMEKQILQARKMEAIGTFAGGIAHDFNNVLGTIIGYGEMIELFDIKKENTVRSHVQKILNAAYRGQSLVEQILTFSRKTEPQKIPVRTESIVNEVLDSLRAGLSANINVVKKNRCDSDMVVADPTQIYQILMNLCKNAGYSMQDSGGTLTVIIDELHNSPENDAPVFGLESKTYIKISVTDTGVGMTSETMEHIFEPFFTSKPPEEGSGMGLAIVHGIVANLDGVINVMSEPGRGTVVEVYLPKYLEGIVPGPAGGDPDTTCRKGCILLVDDELWFMEYLKEILERFGHEIIIKCDAFEALRYFHVHATSIDLVISDQLMPRLTGLELASEIKLSRPDLPIILCSGLPAPVSESELRKSGIDTFIQKTIGAYQLIELVESLLTKTEG